jgi:hypothetical protein
MVRPVRPFGAGSYDFSRVDSNTRYQSVSGPDADNELGDSQVVITARTLSADRDAAIQRSVPWVLLRNNNKYSTQRTLLGG